MSVSESLATAGTATTGKQQTIKEQWQSIEQERFHIFENMWLDMKSNHDAYLWCSQHVKKQLKLWYKNGVPNGMYVHFWLDIIEGKKSTIVCQL